MDRREVTQYPWILLLTGIVTLTGCSERRDVPLAPDVHPDSWMDPVSPDFHGTRAINHGIIFCFSCHKTETEVGDRSVECYRCHDIDIICSICHGDPSRTVAFEPDIDPRSAPPRDLNGNIETTTRGVGAHQSHVTTGLLRVGIDCDECHEKPSSAEDSSHIDGDPPFQAEIVWGELAKVDSDPTYIPGDASRCADVYCHGGGFDENQKGSLTEPTWTTVDGSQSACGTCHQIPPHDDFGVGCEFCHGSVVASDTTITENGKTLHINGEIDF